MKINSNVLLIFFVLLFTKNLNAQYADRNVKAYSQLYKIRRSTTKSITDGINNKIVLPPISNIRAKNLNNKETSNRLKTLQFAEKRHIDINPLLCGEVLKTDNGRFLWQMTIISKGAKSIGLHFSKFDLPIGASVFVRGKNGVKGAYTYINNDKEFQISPVEGDSIVVEYNFPDNCTEVSRKDIPIHINELYHDYLGVFSFLRNNNQGEPLFNYNNSALEELVCAPNIINYPEINNQSRGVVLLVINGTSVGTGSLINNKRNDGKPYILTASHVVNDNFSNEDNLDIVKHNCVNTVVFFNFSSMIGNKNIRATEEQSLYGTKIVAYNKDADMTLLEITGLVNNDNGKKTIPKEYRPYYNGWDINKSPQSTYFGIHHPMASTKRYSQVKGEMLEIEDYDVFAGSVFKSFDKKHWHVKEWEIGTTAAGSSGSPLFDKKGLIIGALTGGSSDCSTPFDDYYYALKEVWTDDKTNVDKTNYLSYWLDPDNTGDLQCDGLDSDDSENIKLLTNISGRKEVKDLHIVKLRTNYRNVANLFKLKSNDKVLGAFLSFVGDNSIYIDFPNIDISLSPIVENKKAPELFKLNVPQPKYKAYDREKQKLIDVNRWLDNDTCQVFIPFGKYTIDKDGDYLLQLQSMQGLNRLNLLGLNTLLQKDNICRNNSFFVDKDNNIKPFDNGQLSIWLDLLIERRGDKDQCDDYICYGDGLNINKLSYYSNGLIYINKNIVGENKFNWTITFFDVLGNKIFEKRLDDNQQTFEMNDIKKQVVSGVYLVKVRANGKKISYKIKL